MNIDFKHLRETRGISQKEISEKTGMTPATLSRLENGLTVPSIKTVDRYLNAIGMELKVVDK